MVIYIYIYILFPYFWSVTRFIGEILRSIVNIVRYIKSNICAVFDVF